MKTFRSRGQRYHFYIISDPNGDYIGRLHNNQVLSTNRDVTIYEYFDDFLDEAKKIDKDIEKKTKDKKDKDVYDINTDYFLLPEEIIYLEDKDKVKYKKEKDKYLYPDPDPMGMTQS